LQTESSDSGLNTQGTQTLRLYVNRAGQSGPLREWEGGRKGRGQRVRATTARVALNKQQEVI
jgi:hypothetical protein